MSILAKLDEEVPTESTKLPLATSNTDQQPTFRGL